MNIKSHKIIFASISNYVKHLLSEFPLGDEVTIFLPDYTGERVRKFINAAVFLDSFYEEELSRHFRAHKPKQRHLSQSKIEPTFAMEEKHLETNPINESKAEFTDLLDSFYGEELSTHFRAPKQGHDSQYKIEPTFEVKEKHPETNPNNVSKAEFTDLPLEETRLTPAEQTIIRVMKKRMAYGPAIKEVKSGQFINFSVTAKKFGVSSATLKRLVKTNKDYQGRGNKSPFSFEEEQDLIKRIMLASKNGENLSYKLLRDLIREESSKMVTSNPERLVSFSRYLNPSHNNIYDFAKKHSLDTLLKKKRNLVERRLYDCDYCTKSFTFKNSMLAHKRKVHHSFLEK